MLVVGLSFLPIVGGVSGLQPLAQAQLVLPSTTSSSGATQLPPNVRRIGGAEIAPVYFQGQLLLEVASPSVLNRDNPGEALPVEIRAKLIEDDLNYVVSFTNPDLRSEEEDYRTVYDPDTFSVQVSIFNGQTVVTASDENRSSPQVLATVTDTDAEYYGLTQTQVGELWRDRIRAALSQALQERSPQALKAWSVMAVSMLLGLVVLSVVSWLLYRRMARVKHDLEHRKREEMAETTVPPALRPDNPTTETEMEDTADQRFDFLNRLKQSTDLQQRLSLLNFGGWLLVWGVLLVWVVAIAFLVNRFPLGQLTAWDVLLKPQIILLIWFVAGLANRLLEFAMTRASILWQTTTVYSSEEMQRRQLRISTTLNVLSGMKTVIIYLLAIFFSLNTLGFNTNSLLAFGALLGFAMSLAAQNVIRDLVNGFLVLLEDQYAIGDVIEIDADTSGLVENLNLRVTQLRDGEGRLITLPNSQIGRVVNLTRLWARVDEAVFVDANADVQKALTIVQSVAESLYNDARFRSVIIDPPTVLGIESMSHAGVEIRTQIKTKPAEQWVLAREFRLRVKTALEEKGLAFGRPQQDVWRHQ